MANISVGNEFEEAQSRVGDKLWLLKSNNKLCYRLQFDHTDRSPESNCVPA